jgi:hypothetical protein
MVKKAKQFEVRKLARRLSQAKQDAGRGEPGVCVELQSVFHRSMQAARRMRISHTGRGNTMCGTPKLQQQLEAAKLINISHVAQQVGT